MSHKGTTRHAHSRSFLQPSTGPDNPKTCRTRMGQPKHVNTRINTEDKQAYFCLLCLCGFYGQGPPLLHPWLQQNWGLWIFPKSAQSAVVLWTTEFCDLLSLWWSSLSFSSSSWQHFRGGPSLSDLWPVSFLCSSDTLMQWTLCSHVYYLRSSVTFPLSCLLWLFPHFLCSWMSCNLLLWMHAVVFLNQKLHFQWDLSWLKVFS